MTRDDLLAAALVLAFAVLVTAHVAIVAGLLGEKPRARAIVALVVAPLAPYWALRGGMRVRGGIWVVSAVGYVVLRGGGGGA
jgi:hypothetical protein